MLILQVILNDLKKVPNERFLRILDLKHCNLLIWSELLITVQQVSVVAYQWNPLSFYIIFDSNHSLRTHSYRIYNGKFLRKRLTTNYG